MPVIKWFAYTFPNRRNARSVVEIALHFLPADKRHYAMDIAPIRQCLEKGGILDSSEAFPPDPLPNDFTGWYTSLLVQMALLFQCKVGHRVGYYTVCGDPEQSERGALMEHEHCDVGMTAVKLAAEVMSGKRKLLATPFEQFSVFAADRLLPIDIEAIIAAARRRGIPAIQLERQPLRREQFDHLTGGDCLRRNGLLMLGHGAHQQVLDGFFCLTKSGDLKRLLNDKEKRQDLLQGIGVPLAKSGSDDKATERRHQYLLVNGQVVAARTVPDGSWTRPGALGHAMAENLLQVAHAVGFAAVSVTMVPDGEVVDFDLSPRLDRHLEGAQHTALLEHVSDMLVDCLFGNVNNSRMPVIAITGTNGKTTTARMIREVLDCAGDRPGLVCTDGIYLGNEQVADTDRCAASGHMKVLTSTAVNRAVLESHHAGILRNGFAFDRCEVAICTTVANDHLGPDTVSTVKEMAVVKRALLERATDAAVLNADNEHCLDMIKHLSAEKVCLVSTSAVADDLLQQGPEGRTCCCVLELVDDEEWVVIYDTIRVPVVPVASMPATFEGRAAFNMSNAMHAVRMDFDITPGRLNFYDAYPFDVLMDAMKNPAGAKALCRFVGQIKTPGRKYLMVQVRGDRDEDFIKTMGAALAGQFDHYICQTHSVYPGEPKDRAPVLVKAALLEAGVADEQITIMADLSKAVDTLLRMGSEGDLLVFAPGTGQPKSEVWSQILAFGSELDAGTRTRPVSSL
jgi:UDP-N-acetylmuramyl tripeptide synthase